MQKEILALESHLQKQHKKRIAELDVKVDELEQKKGLMEKQDQTYSARAVKNKAAEDFLGDNKHRQIIQGHLSQQREMKHLKISISELKERISGRGDQVEEYQKSVRDLERKKLEVSREAGLTDVRVEEDEDDSDSEDEEIKRMMEELNREKMQIQSIMEESSENFQEQIDGFEEKVSELRGLDDELAVVEKSLNEAEEKWGDTCANIPTELIKLESEYLQSEEQLESIKRDIQEVKNDMETEDDEEERESMGEEIEDLVGQAQDIAEEMVAMEAHLINMQKQISAFQEGENRIQKIKGEIQKLKDERAMLEEYVETGLPEKTKKILQRTVGNIKKVNDFCEENDLKVEYSLNVKVKKDIHFQVREVVREAKLSRVLTLRQFAKRVKWMGKGPTKYEKIVGKAIIVELARCEVSIQSLLYAVAKQNFSLKVTSNTQREIGELQIALETISSAHFDVKDEEELIGKPFEVRVYVNQLALKSMKARKCYVQFSFYEEDDVETKKVTGESLVFNLEQVFKIEQITPEVLQYIRNSSIEFVIFGDLYEDLVVSSGGSKEKKDEGKQKVEHAGRIEEEEEEEFSKLPDFKFKLVRVTCYEADGLNSARKLKMFRQSVNPYCKIKFKGTKKKTTIWKKKQNPQWLQTVSIKLKKAKYSDKLNIQVANNERMMRNSVIGELDLALSECYKSGKVAAWFTIKKENLDAGRVKLSFEFE